jgi:hypothetical protein
MELKDSRGMTPILRAVKDREPLVALKLLKLGAYPMKCDRDGVTILLLSFVSSPCFFLEDDNLDEEFNRLIRDICQGVHEGRWAAAAPGPPMAIPSLRSVDTGSI